MHPRPLSLALSLALALTLSPAAAAPDPPKGSVKVRVLRLEGVPKALEPVDLAVRVSIGGRLLYETRPAPGRAPSWNAGLRAWTASARPLVFEVVGGGDGPAAAPEPPRPASKAQGEPPRRRDDVLADGMDDFVADYGSGRLDQDDDDATPARRLPARRPVAARAGGKAACRAELAWPPEDGEHRLACGGMTLVVRTQKL